MEEHMATEHRQAQPLPTALPVAPDFPVTWAQPADAQLFWSFDPMVPDAMSPLDFLSCRDAFSGFNAAAAVYDLPIRLESRHINTYFYQAVIPAETNGASAVAEAASNGRRPEGPLEAAMAGLSDLWK